MWKLVTAAFMAAGLVALSSSPAAAAGRATVVANDNTRPAGTTAGEVVRIRLRAAPGSWQPEGPERPVLAIEALGEEGAALSVPAPLIRVVEGTRLEISVHNELAAPLRLNGLCTRDGSPCAPLDIPPGERREVAFASGRAGTYHYWGSTMNAPVPFRELAGAFVVDPPGDRSPDRVFVITEWTSLTAQDMGRIMMADLASEAFLASKPRLTFVINGLSWPATERLTYRRGETVRWRIVNLSSQHHPMHLHGFYFTVERSGDGRRDEPVAGGAGRQVVTHIVPSGATMTMRWTPEREGNWLFHCHVMHHVSPERRLDAPAEDGTTHGSHPPSHHGGSDDPGLGMAGMVLGIRVLPPADARPSEVRDPVAPAPRRLTMTIRPQTPASATGPVALISVTEAASDATDAQMRRSEMRKEPSDTETTGTSPGPTIALRRGEPTEITVRNELPVATSIHWHGLELDSLYDGVHGWSGSGRSLAPMVEPGGSFVVRITPPRAGTFIYHTHLHDYQQLTSGLYGGLIVTDEGEVYDPAVDHVVILGRSQATAASGILEDAASAVINGDPAPRMIWAAGRRHRVRLINITPDDILGVSLIARDAPARWLPLTKDGAPVPASEAEPTAALMRIAVGETYDFAVEAPPGRGTLWLEVRSSSGKWQSQARIVVR